MAIKILIVSDFLLLCEGLHALFQQEDDLEIVAEATDGKETKEKIQQCLPDLVLLDIALLDGDAQQITEWITKTHPQIKVVAWSSQGNPDYIFRILQAGASGVLLNDFRFPEVVKAIRQVTSGQVYLNPKAAQILVEKVQGLPDKVSLVHPELTAREREVLNLLVHGNKNAQIAEQLNISPKTVESHRSNLLKKLGLKSIVELTRYAIQIGLISGEMTIS